MDNEVRKELDEIKSRLDKLEILKVNPTETTEPEKKE